MLILKWIGIAIGIWLIGGIALGVLLVLAGGDSMGSGIISAIAGSFIAHRGYRKERDARRQVTTANVGVSADSRNDITY